MPSSPLPSQTFVELPLVCKPQNKWEAKSEGSQQNAAMARLIIRPIYPNLCSQDLPNTGTVCTWNTVTAQIVYRNGRKESAKWSSCGRPHGPPFLASPLFQLLFIHSSCVPHAGFSLVIFSSLGHSTPLCRSDVPSHPSWNSRKWSPRNGRSTDRLPL